MDFDLKAKTCQLDAGQGKTMVMLLTALYLIETGVCLTVIIATTLEHIYQ